MTAWKCAIAVLVFALALSGATPASPGYAAYEKANALFVEKKLPEALAAVDEALRLDPKLVPALTLKAKLAMAAYRLDVARQCLEQALAIDPRAPYAQFLYGLEAYLGNDMKAALPRFRKARQLNPADPRAALYLALTVESLGQPAEAMSLYEEAVRLERSANELHAETLLPGARLLLLLGRLDEMRALAACRQPSCRRIRAMCISSLRAFCSRRAMRSGPPPKGRPRSRLSEGIVTDAAIRYLLIRAYQKLGMADRAAIHAEIMRTQESPAGNNEEVRYDLLDSIHEPSHLLPVRRPKQFLNQAHSSRA